MSRSAASLPLFDTASPGEGEHREACAPRVPERGPRRRELWLCLLFPRLPLETRSGGEADAMPLVIVENDGTVLMASGPAEDAGIGPGLPLNAAWALCPALVARERDEPAEQAALERLAAWSGRFTSLVHLAGPDALLLEIGRSLRLFGGCGALVGRLRRRLVATGHEVVTGVAPTPLAALWLARAGDETALEDPETLPDRLGRLSVAVTGWPKRTRETLSGLGVDRLADCLRLPRDGFARRLGHGCLVDLDRALGRLPDPRPGFRAPERYAGIRELTSETADLALLGRVADRLFGELEGFLRARQASVDRLLLKFGHLGREATPLVLGLARPDFRAAHFSVLLAERLQRVVLPAPVVSVTLKARPSEGLCPAAAEMFEAPGVMDDSAFRLVERLRARLGREAVHGLALVDEHRPELAWQVTEPGRGPMPAASGRPRRPCWLLSSPRRLVCRDGRPWLDGPLVLESGPERMETGWWDDGEVSRDYWIMRDGDGIRLWVFRERHRSGGWFLHGIFA
ncbi:MAG: DNA polymerase Y family protein [Gammaproteobacteria bacterium]